MSVVAAAAALSLPLSLSRSNKFHARKCLRRGFGVFAIIGEEGGLVERKSPWTSLFDVEDPWAKVPQYKGKFLDVNQALEVARYDIQYCDWKARQDVLTIMLLHEKVNYELLFTISVCGLRMSLVIVFVLYISCGSHKPSCARIQIYWNTSERTSRFAGGTGTSPQPGKVHISEARVSSALDKLAYMETLVTDKILQDTSTTGPDLLLPSSTLSLPPAKSRPPKRSINVSGPVQPYNDHLKNFWYPIAFSAGLKDDTMIPIDCFEEPWVLFRGKDGKPGCVQNTCAHRACPLDLGSINEGRIKCPYHENALYEVPQREDQGTAMLRARGMIWIWPGSDPPTPKLPSLLPPSGFQIHAEIVMELPVEHGLLLDNLLDLAHAPFTHTSTFAKGWSVPSLVKFLTPSTSSLQGYWDPYPIDMEFQPPCMVLSMIGISKPGKLQGQSIRECATHLHQLHVCLPSSKQKTRLLYRMSLDFAPILKHVPFMQHLWRYFAEKVLNEDLRLVLGQQERMLNGANVWNLPVSYDKLGVRYRQWRDSVERGSKELQSQYNFLD
ncbi:hypothetical protein SASPL_150099 [Salvia splendens]|uniref:Rieske domain-containing protein n=1 Tax=Salvia splendens TaxID=180675 RepID=A0A8X8Z2J4_SALSN|nr:hypothetical protein SASPL_150099 [Salvia splendens]